jgi:penicillin-binding protein 1B
MSTTDRPPQGTLPDRRSGGWNPGRTGKGRSGRNRRVVHGSRLVRFLLHPVGKILVGLVLLVVLAGAGVFIYYYNEYAKVIDQRLRGGPYTATSRIYAAPESVDVGDTSSPGDIASALRRAGYNENPKNTTGYYAIKPDSIDIFPGAESYFDQEPAAIRFSRNKIDRIVSLRDNTERPRYELEPQLVTNLHNSNREKQRLIRYEDIPPILRDSILAAEDHRFFSDPFIDPIGIVRAAWVDLRGHSEQGASTLTMQLSKNMFLTPERTWKRKAAEVMIAMELEQKLTKEQIFELYCNQMDLGHRGSFEIRGFGEAAQTYFGKDIKSLTVPEAATLAAMLKSASYYSPWLYPQRARERRNTVLSMMREDKYIDDRTYALAVESPIRVMVGQAESSDAPYFVDLVNDDLSRRFPGTDFQKESARIYTTLDLDLQKFANEAVAAGMKEVDAIARRQKRFRGVPFVEPQCALIALDPHTGEIKALAGGRNYGVSQLNRVNAQRPTGSIFKPFVYATALNTGITPGAAQVLTPSTIVVDEPTSFFVAEGQDDYSPRNFEKEFLGAITYRTALAKSINVAAVKVAQLVGYDKVVDLAHRAGMNEEVLPTPSMAIGAYVATPLEMSGAYTVFANGGVRVQPTFLSLVKQPNGKVMLDQKPEKKVVLDPRVNAVLVDMLQEVMRTGTAAGVRGRGFIVPAAGKTGTDPTNGWFAGFTTDLLCIVWVGFDDNRPLEIEGAHSALPVWTEFMKRAITLKQYANPKPFSLPDGVVTVPIDPPSGLRASSACPQKPVDEVFIAGTEPTAFCGKAGGTTVSGWDVSSTEPAIPAQPYIPGLPPRRGPSDTTAPPARRGAVGATGTPAPQNTTPTPEPKKKGLFAHIKDIFR